MSRPPRQPSRLPLGAVPTLGLVLVGVSPVLVFVLLGVCHALPLALVVGTRTDRAPLVIIAGYVLVVAVGAQVL